MNSPSSAATRFADYFVICGLDVESGLEPDQLAGDNLHCVPLERPFKAKSLAHYPENVPWNPFDKAAVGMLCYPRGVSFRIEVQERPSRFHSFLITKEDGSRTYAGCYTFYEEVVNSEICAAMQTLHAMHLAELSNDQSRTLYSHLGPVHERSPKSKQKHGVNMANFYDISKDTLYVTKCICILSQMPFVTSIKEFLSTLHSAVIGREKPPLPLESYVYNILYEVPLPPPGRSMKFSVLNKSIYCQRPGISELPFFEYSLQELFSLIGIENVLQVFTSFLLEHQILLYSCDYHQLMLVAEGISCLIFPFQWQHVYVPILPAALTHFLDAPVPFVMGLHHCGEDRSQLQLPSEANMCFVDIDNKVVDTPEDLPTFPNINELREEVTDVFVKYLVPDTNTSLDSENNAVAAELPLDYNTKYYRDSLKRHNKNGNKNEPGNAASSREGRKSSIPQNRYEILQQSEAMQKVAAIAKKTGVISSLDDVHDDLSGDDVGNANEPKKANANEQNNQNNNNMEKTCLAGMVFNNAMREIFLNHLVYMFISYESFVIQPSQDMESWLTNRESMQNFDKAAFLSDQPDTYLPFLCPFLETQMFTTFIDNKIMSQWEDPEPSLRLFEARMKAIKESNGELRTHQYSRCINIRDSEALLEKRAAVIDHIAIEPHALDTKSSPTTHKRGFFPKLDSNSLNREPVTNRSARRGSASWRRKDRLFQHTQHLGLNSDQREYALAEKHARLWLKYIQEARSKSVRQPKLSDMAPAAMSQTNWKFVETLLKECKAKTKRMVVEKMGQEAVELGHDEGTVTGVEENTLIAGLCDLLERIWSHGLQTKQGKSALWSHLLNYQTVEECKDTSKPIDPNFLTPDSTPWSGTSALVWCVLRKRFQCRSRSHSLPRARARATNMHAPLHRLQQQALPDISAMALEAEIPDQEKKLHRRKHSRSPEPPTLKPLPTGLVFDMKNVQKMSEIKTDVGYARAWVRLALEKKVLSTHLKELLSDGDLLKSLYKRYAFLRCEDEREQFLYHLLALNAVDYYAFTNSFVKTVIPYRLIICPGKRFSAASTTTANVWMYLSGQLGETGIIHLPRHSLEHGFEHKNLGVLTTLRVGHDNTGMSPKWIIDYLLMRNEVTNHTYRFPCGRWLGKGIDDGSSERLLVAEQVPPMANYDTEPEWTGSLPRSMMRTRSPSASRRGSEVMLTIPQIQELLGDSVNSIVKHFYKPEKERGSLTILLCGENGIVPGLERMFQYGFKSARLFRNKFFIWDYLEKIQTFFETLLYEDVERELDERRRRAYMSYKHVMSRINASTQSIGKDGKYQVFICIAIRDQMLTKWLPAMAETPVTQSMYEEQSFLRDPQLLTFVIHILDSLKEFNITLEASLTKGVNI
ncbi:DENN domain-containing protein 5B-like isoform X3 [Lineus longissimus]|uniref:DENN domain-containing protein 5B-like isoform X3 n=1 Tax=Lineus longissimus TaxID=88925 RepID=UPI00315D070F